MYKSRRNKIGYCASCGSTLDDTLKTFSRCTRCMGNYTISMFLRHLWDSGLRPDPELYTKINNEREVVKQKEVKSGMDHEYNLLHGRVCVGCEKHKPANEFSFLNRRGKRRLNPRCIPCFREYNRKLYTRYTVYNKIDSKECKKCEKVKPVSEYHVTYVRGRKLLCHECKECVDVNRKDLISSVKCEYCGEVKPSSEYIVKLALDREMLHFKCNKCVSSSKEITKVRNTPKMETNSKKCSRCGEKKPLKEYNVRKSDKGVTIFHGACKVCLKKYRRKHYVAVKDRNEISKQKLVDYMKEVV